MTMSPLWICYTTDFYYSNMSCSGGSDYTGPPSCSDSLSPDGSCGSPLVPPESDPPDGSGSWKITYLSTYASEALCNASCV